eukprot:188282_1
MSYRNYYHNTRNHPRRTNNTKYNKQHNNGYTNGSNSNPNRYYNGYNSFTNEPHTHSSNNYYTNKYHTSNQSNRRYKGYNPFVDNTKENKRHKQTLATCKKINKQYKRKAHKPIKSNDTTIKHIENIKQENKNDQSESYYYAHKSEPLIKSVPLIKHKQIEIEAINPINSSNSSPDTLLSVSEASPTPLISSNKCDVIDNEFMETFLYNNNLIIQHHLESLQYFSSLLPNLNGLNNCNDNIDLL